MKEILNTLRHRKEESIKLLEKFVLLESFSADKAGIDRLSSEIAEVFMRFTNNVTIIQEKEYGDHLRIQLGNGTKQILLISHLDTVYPKGTIDTMPFVVEGDKAKGPGVIDIKASYVMVYHLFELLENEQLGNYQLVWLLTSDEEIGSPSGRKVVEQEAEKSEVVLVLEPATDNGEFKIARKGGGNFTVEVSGVSAHAGLNPKDGANAIEELAYQIVKIVTFADDAKGTTINTGKIEGGSTYNVVPAYASCEIDVRVAVMEEGKRIEKAFSGLTAKNPKTKLKVTGSVYRPPLEQTVETNKLFQLAKEIAEKIDVDLKGNMVGGGSDGNFAAQTGTPVLDGLGPFGGFAHSPNEFLLVDSIAERTTILYGLILELIGTWGQSPNTLKL